MSYPHITPTAPCISASIGVCLVKAHFITPIAAYTPWLQAAIAQTLEMAIAGRTAAVMQWQFWRLFKGKPAPKQLVGLRAT